MTIPAPAALWVVGWVALATPGMAMTLNCVPHDMGSWQDGALNTSPLASDEPAATPFVIELESGAYFRPAAEGRPLEDWTYTVLEAGDYHPNANLDYVALDRERLTLLRIKLEGDVFSFIRDYGRTIEVGTCLLVMP